MIIRKKNIKYFIIVEKYVTDSICYAFRVCVYEWQSWVTPASYYQDRKSFELELFSWAIFKKNIASLTLQTLTLLNIFFHSWRESMQQI